jgi:flagellar export protein FliJ
VATLASLIKLRRFELDQARRRLVDLQRAAAALDAERARLDEMIMTESAAAEAASDPEAVFAFGRFVQQAIQRRSAVDDARARAEAEIAAQLDSVRSAFEQQKSLELAQAAADAREAKRRAGIESAALDEMGLEAFRRRQ